ncbi:UNVERIFIED_CONTAM: hypothetical protein Sradi_1780100 [Sesamum radiatum]|uniref:Uncharacterized protein n=1 Tax=Sesamum radiatum TaxID=300843 RepID=A0AAW2S8V2_SESRA
MIVGRPLMVFVVPIDVEFDPARKNFSESGGVGFTADEAAAAEKGFCCACSVEDRVNSAELRGGNSAEL